MCCPTEDLLSFNLSKGLKICHWYYRDLYSKLSNIQLPLSSGKECHILGISESWLNIHLDTEITIPGYCLVRKDLHSNKRGGGTAIYIHQRYSLIYKEIGY